MAESRTCATNGGEAGYLSIGRFLSVSPSSHNDWLLAFGDWGLTPPPQSRGANGRERLSTRARPHP